MIAMERPALLPEATINFVTMAVIGEGAVGGAVWKAMFILATAAPSRPAVAARRSATGDPPRVLEASGTGRDLRPAARAEAGGLSHGHGSAGTRDPPQPRLG